MQQGEKTMDQEYKLYAVFINGKFSRCITKCNFADFVFHNCDETDTVTIYGLTEVEHFPSANPLDV